MVSIGTDHSNVAASELKTMMIVWRLGQKIIRTVLCYASYDSCAHWYAHTCEQFL